MGWEFTIDGDMMALRWLVRGTAQVSPRVIAADSAYRLEWEGLDALPQGSHDAIESTALQHLKSLAGLASVLLCRHATLQLIDVAFRRPDGGRNVLVNAHDSIRVSATVEAELTVLGPDGQPKQVSSFDPIPRLVELSATDATVAKLLNLSSGDLEDWTALYRLYEILGDAAGGPRALALLAGVPAEKLKIFTGTANSPALSGETSRHGVQTGSLPSKVMSLSEAVQLLRKLSYAWLVARSSAQRHV